MKSSAEKIGANSRARNAPSAAPTRNDTIVPAFPKTASRMADQAEKGAGSRAPSHAILPKFIEHRRNRERRESLKLIQYDGEVSSLYFWSITRATAERAKWETRNEPSVAAGPSPIRPLSR